MSFEKNPAIDNYLQVGCGRCPLGGTPNCKVHSWAAELNLLRELALCSGLQETLKWSVPCYTWSDRNVLVVSAFQQYASMSFFQGALLTDSAGLLITPSENSHAARLLKFTSTSEIKRQKSVILDLIVQAKAVAAAGKQVDFQKRPEVAWPPELQEAFGKNEALQAAFEKLTPGRQRGYLLHFTGAKQSETRRRRIEQCASKILQGKGMHD